MADEIYVETCSELIGSSVGAMDDAVTSLHDALRTQHTAHGAWSDVIGAANTLAYEAEQVAASAKRRMYA